MYDLSSLAVALVFPLVCSFFLSRFGILLSSVIYWFCYYTWKCCATLFITDEKVFLYLGSPEGSHIWITHHTTVEVFARGLQQPVCRKLH